MCGQSNVRDRDLVGFVDDARAAVAREVKLPAGYSLAWGGQFENQQRAAARLMVVVPVALALIFFLLFSTFRSVRQALLVLSNVPFAMIGGIFGLLISGEYLSVPAAVGFIALLGIAVLNGVVMVSYFNQLLARGLPVAEVSSKAPGAAWTGADDRQHRRLRPGPHALRQRSRFRGATAAGHRRHRRPGPLDRPDPGPAPHPVPPLRCQSHRRLHRGSSWLMSCSR